MVAPSGKIRRMTIYQNLAKFEIAGYRYCGNIGREHRSNNICLIVDLNRLLVYQTCYDPDCRGFQSTPTPLPPEVALPTCDDPLLLEVADHTLSDRDLIEFMNGVENIEIQSTLSDVSFVSNHDDIVLEESQDVEDNALISEVPDSLCRWELGDRLLPSPHSEERTVLDMNISDEQLMEIAESAEGVCLLEET